MRVEPTPDTTSKIIINFPRCRDTDSRLREHANGYRVSINTFETRPRVSIERFATMTDRGGRMVFSIGVTDEHKLWPRSKD